jgi:hypothetical protein
MKLNRTSQSLKLLGLLAVCIPTLCIPVASWGQQVTAAINGVVTDSSGSPIANARVTATDTGAGHHAFCPD